MADTPAIHGSPVTYNGILGRVYCYSVSIKQSAGHVNNGLNT